jgi:hypothetical protein
MNLFWGLGFPIVLLLSLLLGLRWTTRLHFFSLKARDLNQIDIANEVREVRIRELEILVSADADAFFRDDLNLAFLQRREAVSKRMSETRKWLHLMISNAELFEQVARFRIGEIEKKESADDTEEISPYRLMDRACMVRVIAVICLGKLTLLEMRRIVWPLYLPALAGRFRVGDRDLILWYRHLMKDVLEMAKRYDDDYEGFYERFTLQLTGTCSIEQAVELNRI